MPPTIDQKLKFRSDTLAVFGKIEVQFGIQPKIGLAQAAHESNWGISQLATEGKNIFSITPGEAWLAFRRGEKKAIDVPGWSSLGIQTVHYPAIEYSKWAPEHVHYFEFPGDIRDKKPDGKGGSILTVDRYFRQYATFDESAWDWARKISHESRYSVAYGAAKQGDLVAFAMAVAAAGYATENRQDYADMVVSAGRAVAALATV